MSIPIKDINAGDTISSMVDKINFNFDLLALKGGGVQGVQGVQGVRGSVGIQGIQGVQGVKGNGLINGQGVPQGIGDDGDVYINGEDGSIYENQGGNWVCIYNPTDTAESPFTYHTSIQDKIAIRQRVNIPVIIGTDNAGLIGNIAQSSDKGALNITSSGNAITIFGGGAQNVAVTMGASNGIDFTILNQGNIHIGNSINDSICVDLVGKLKISGYADTSHNGKRALVAVNNQDGIVGFDTPQWFIEHEGNFAGSLFPEANYNLGLKEPNNRIKDIYIRPDSVVYCGNVIDSDNKFPKFKTKDPDNVPKTVMGWSQNGVSLGIESAAFFDNFINADTFGLYVGSDRFASQNPKGYAPYIAMKPANTNIDSGNTDLVLQTMIGYINTTTTDVGYAISFSSQLNCAAYEKDLISPILTVFDDAQKNSGDRMLKRMLKLKGRNGLCGEDILVQGGDSVSSGGFGDNANQHKYVGGNVFVSGGGAIRKNANISGGHLPSTAIMGDMRNLGNVIIGINPNNHKTIQSTVYGSAKTDEEISATDPKDIDFFDVADVAIHGNRIVIDSHANQRKLEQAIVNQRTMPTGGSGGTGSGSSKGMSGGGSSATTKPRAIDGTPYIETLNDSTLQVSALNTIYHEEPIVVSIDDIYYHQFLCGTMNYVMGFYYNGSDAPEVFLVDNDKFFKLIKSANTNSVSTKIKNSLLLQVQQTWQKVGNVVNVSARCEWFAYNNYTDGSSDDRRGLHRIFNGMLRMLPPGSQFAQTNVKYWCNGATAHNETLCNVMGIYKTYKGYTGYFDLLEDSMFADTNIFHKQPMSMIRTPYSVISSRNMFCNGGGSIITEIYDSENISKKSLLNHNVFIGNEPPFNSYSNNSLYDSAYHSQYGKIKGSKISENTSGEKFDGKTFNTSSSRFNVTSNPWGEGYFPKMMINGDAYTYVIPTMLCSWFNRNGNITDNINEMLRPVVGLYTAMNFNYSYVLGPKLNSTPFVSFRKYQSDGNEIGNMGYKVPGVYGNDVSFEEREAGGFTNGDK